MEKLSELIQKLQEIQSKEGDILVGSGNDYTDYYSKIDKIKVVDAFDIDGKEVRLVSIECDRECVAGCFKEWTA